MPNITGQQKTELTPQIIEEVLFTVQKTLTAGQRLVIVINPQVLTVGTGETVFDGTVPALKTFPARIDVSGKLQ